MFCCLLSTLAVVEQMQRAAREAQRVSKLFHERIRSQGIHDGMGASQILTEY
jgi:hypothetical protein